MIPRTHILLFWILVFSAQAKQPKSGIPPEITKEIVESYKEISEQDIQDTIAEFNEQPNLLAAYPQKDNHKAEKEIRKWLSTGKAEVLYKAKDLLVLEYFNKADMRNPKLARSPTFWINQNGAWKWARTASGKLWVFDLDQDGKKDIVMIDGCCGHSEVLAVLNPNAQNVENSTQFGWAEMTSPNGQGATYGFDSISPGSCKAFHIKLRDRNAPKRIKKILFDCKKREFYTPDAS